jgi:isoamylase
LATLLLSQGTPMLLAGDELDRTQHGNNNAYCQDNEINWIDWASLDRPGPASELHAFARELIKLRREHRVFRRDRFLRGRPLPGSVLKDIMWLRPDGKEKTHQDWDVPFARSLLFVLTGEAAGYHLDAAGEPEVDDTFLVSMNAGQEGIDFRPPPLAADDRWHVLIDTTTSDGLGGDQVYEAGETINAAARSLLLLVRERH